MWDRAKINYIGFEVAGEGPDSDGTYSAKLSDCPCSNRLIPKGKHKLFCPGCSNEISMKDDKEHKDKLKSKHGKKGKNKLFAISQTMTTKKPDHVEEAERIFGGEVTSWNESEYSYDQ